MRLPARVRLPVIIGHRSTISTPAGPENAAAAASLFLGRPSMCMVRAAAAHWLSIAPFAPSNGIRRNEHHEQSALRHPVLPDGCRGPGPGGKADLREEHPVRGAAGREQPVPHLHHRERYVRRRHRQELHQRCPADLVRSGGGATVPGRKFWTASYPPSGSTTPPRSTTPLARTSTRRKISAPRTRIPPTGPMPPSCTARPGSPASPTTISTIWSSPWAWSARWPSASRPKSRCMNGSAPPSRRAGISSWRTSRG